MIVLMGAAGAGKGTQSQLLRQEIGYDYVSTGEILREFATESQHQRMLTGELLSDAEIISIVEQALAKLAQPRRCILDGFPRTLVQVDWLIAQVTAGRFPMPTIINLDIDEATVHERLSRRGRQDDAESVISRRFREYQSITLPVLERFREGQAQIVDINAHQSPEAVHTDIMAALDGRIQEA